MSYSWLYVIINALSALLRQVGATNLPPALILLTGSIISIFFFNIVNLKNLKQIYQHCWTGKKDWFYMNLSIAVLWTCAVYSPGYIGASLYIYLYFAVLGLIGIIALTRRGKGKTASQLISMTGTAILLIYVGINNLLIIHTEKELIGIILACLGGATGFLYSIQSAKFMKKASLSASQILAVRFYLAIVLSLILLPLHANIAVNSRDHLALLFIVASFSFIVPLYFAQKGIHKIGPELNAIIISTTPLSTAILEQLCFHNVAWSYFFIYSLYSLFISVPYLNKWYRQIYYR